MDSIVTYDNYVDMPLNGSSYSYDPCIEVHKDIQLSATQKRKYNEVASTLIKKQKHEEKYEEPKKEVIFSKDNFKNYIHDIVQEINKRESRNILINVNDFCDEIYSVMSDNMTSNEVIQLTMNTAYYKTTYEPDYEYLAATLAWKEHHKQISKDFIKVLEDMYNNKSLLNGQHEPRIDKQVLDFAKKHEAIIKKTINYDLDFKLSYFSYNTLCKSYFQKLNRKIIETAQHLFMRVAVGIHYKSDDIENAMATYNDMSQGYFIHATPTLFNAGTIYAQNSSCFLLTIKDSMKGICDVLGRCALISKHAGGIGISISSIRAKGTPIRSTGGHSKGIIPMLRVFNATARYCDQGGDKRKGSFAFYLEPWHAEIMDFLEVRLNHGDEELRARDIFTGLWIPDLFMKRVKEDGVWSLFCPCKVKDKYGKSFEDIYGDEFEQLYVLAEKDKIYNEQMSARTVYKAIIKSQMECSLPYMLYKDHVNRKSNQKNIGIIRGSNLCTEIVEYTDEEHDSVCNLASLSLPKYIIDGIFNHELLGKKVCQLVINLNRIIDVNAYPVETAERTNKKHRPIGIGIQGLADVFAMLGYAWDSSEAKLLNRLIFETIYYYAVKKSSELGLKEGSYACFEGSPISQGILQCDMWNVQPITDINNDIKNIPKYDWNELREMCKRSMRNSLLISPMPTASTAQILGNNESIEMFTNIIYSRKVLSGEYVIVNKHLVKELTQLNLWNKEMVNDILRNNGSVQSINIPQNIKNVYKTVWEMSQKVIIDLAADRAPFIDQTQSLNVHIPHPRIGQLSSLHMYTWEKGLKTGMYYLRTLAARNAVQFTIMEQISEIKNNIRFQSNMKTVEKNNEILNQKQECLIDDLIKTNKKIICNEDICIMCSS